MQKRLIYINFPVYWNVPRDISVCVIDRRELLAALDRGLRTLLDNISVGRQGVEDQGESRIQKREIL